MTPRPDVCLICKEPEPKGGQQVGSWAGIHGPTFVLCKRCVMAGRDARIKARAEALKG